MELFMRVSGKIIFTTVEENYIMRVATFMKVSLWTIWLKALVFTNMLMGASTLGTGTKTNNMVLEKKSGMTWVCIRDFIRMLQKKDRANTAGLMETAMLENGAKICLTVKDFSFGMMIDFTLETGKIIWCTVKAFTNGVMVEYSWELMSTIGKVEWVAIYGLMVELIMENGLPVSSTEQVFILFLTPVANNLK
jgi:hypothetical protein